MLRTLEEAPGGGKSNLSQGMSLLEQVNARLGRESGMANREAFSTDAANKALMDYLSGKGTAQAAAEAFSKIANEAIASGRLTAAEVSALEGYINTTQMYVDVLGLLGDNGVVSGAGTGGVPGAKLTEPTLPRGSKPKGEYEKPDVNDPRPIERQNQSADLLAGEGYDVTMLPEKSGGNGYGIEPRANPDFLIDNEPFDCYSPNSMSVRNIWSTVADKTVSQSGRIVLNLNDYGGSIDALYNQFMGWPIDTLLELLIIKDGYIIRWIP